MARRSRTDDWDEDDVDPPEEDDGDDTVPCPYCRRPIHEEAQRCPHCEQYISEEDAPAQPKPVWIIAGVLLCLLLVVLWILGG